MTAAVKLDGPIGLPLGVHENIPAEHYHARELGVVSKGALDRVERSPAHYRAWIAGEIDDTETKALTIGKAFHCAVLEPSVFEKEYASRPHFGDGRLKKTKLLVEEWEEANKGKIAIPWDEAVRIERMRAAVMSHPLCRSIFTAEGLPELTVTWRDESGLDGKVRGDWAVKKLSLLADLKTTEDASPEAFRRSVVKYRYHVQDALYRFAFNSAGMDLRHFLFVAVEKNPPYSVGVYTLDADGIARGYEHARKNITTLAECFGRGVWPAYGEGIQELELPPWA